MHNSI